MLRPDVAIISPYPPVGARHEGNYGVGSYTANLASALAGHGAGVAVVAPRESDRRVTEWDGPVQVLRTFPRGPLALPAAFAAARDTGAPAIHLQHEHFLYGGPEAVPGLLSALARQRRHRARTVVTAHQIVDPGTVDAGFTRLHRVRVPASLARSGLGTVQAGMSRLSDRVIVHEQRFLTAMRRARVIHHGIETPASVDRATAREDLGLDEDQLVALCFGFVAPYKGLEVALDAARLLDRRVQVVVAGGAHPRLTQTGDPYFASLRDRYGAVARFTGYVPEPDVGRWFGASDVAVFSYPRPFSASGGVALALAHGLAMLLSPEMAAAMQAPPSLVVARSPEALARRLERLATVGDDRRALRRATRQLAAGRRWTAVASRHLDLYQELRRAQRDA